MIDFNKVISPNTIRTWQLTGIGQVKMDNETNFKTCKKWNLVRGNSVDFR